MEDQKARFLTDKEIERIWERVNLLDSVTLQRLEVEEIECYLMALQLKLSASKALEAKKQYNTLERFKGLLETLKTDLAFQYLVIDLNSKLKAEVFRERTRNRLLEQEVENLKKNI